jgi:hypothetical protein
VKIFPGVISQYGQRLIRNFVPVATSIAILRRKITIDSTSDALAFRSYCDRLGNFDPAALKNENIAVEIQNSFVSRCEKWQEEQQRKN